MGDPDMTSIAWGAIVAMLVVGYLLGSVPFGLILTRMAGLGDIRAIGSGNIGATNVLRTGRKALAAATVLLDGLKGTVAVLIGWRFGIDGALAAGFAAFVGHCFPVWLQFKGGKGVATYLGVLLGLYWPAMIIAALVWLGTAALSRYSSLSALMMSGSAPIVLALLGHWPEAALAVVLAAILWIRHGANLKRLLAGEEPRIGRGA